MYVIFNSVDAPAPLPSTSEEDKLSFSGRYVVHNVRVKKSREFYLPVERTDKIVLPSASEDLL